MFCLIYRFVVKLGREEQFCRNWRQITEYLVQHAGSFGSRLHASAMPGEFIAYAQWPTRDCWQKGLALADNELDTYVRAIREACTTTEVLYEMDLVDEHRPGQL